VSEKSVEEKIIEAVIKKLKNAGIVKQVHYGYPTKVIDRPFIWVETSPSVETRFNLISANTFQDVVCVDVGVYVRHLDGEKAEREAGQLAEKVRQMLSQDPTLGGVVDWAVVERMYAEPGREGDQAVAIRRLVLACRLTTQL